MTSVFIVLYYLYMKSAEPKDDIKSKSIHYSIKYILLITIIKEALNTIIEGVFHPFYVENLPLAVLIITFVPVFGFLFLYIYELYHLNAAY